MIQSMQSPLTLTPESVRTLFQLACLCFKQGKLTEAAGHFTLLTMTEPKNYNYWIWLGTTLQKMKNYEKAIEAYEVAAALNPADPKLHMHAADCLFGLGNTKQALFALDCAERAIKSVKESKQDKNLLAHISLMKKAWKQKARQG